MAQRYNKIRFDLVKKGRGVEFTKKEYDGSFLKSSSIVIDNETGKLRLADDYSVQDLSTGTQYNFWEDGINLIAQHSALGHKVFLFVTTVPGVPTILKQTDFGSFAVAYTVVGANPDEPDYLLSFKDKVIGFYTSGSQRKIIYATSLPNDWTEADWDFSYIKDHVVGSDGYLYVVDVNDKIIRTLDGLTWVLFYEETGVRINEIEELDGFVYAIVGATGFQRNSFARFENDKLVYLHHFVGDAVDASIQKLDGGTLFVSALRNNIIDIYRYDGGVITKVSFVDDFIFNGCKMLHSTGDDVYFTCKSDESNSSDDSWKYLYKINKNNGVFHIKTFTDFFDIGAMIDYKGKLSIQVRDKDDDFAARVYDNGAVPSKVQLTGDMEYPIISIGKHIPGYIIGRFDKLPADTTINIYIKKDKAATWGSAVRSFTTDGAVSFIEKLDGIGESDFIQIKLELVTTTNTNTPENVELVYLYTPNGLESSK